MGAEADYYYYYRIVSIIIVSIITTAITAISIIIIIICIIRIIVLLVLLLLLLLLSLLLLLVSGWAGVQWARRPTARCDIIRCYATYTNRYNIPIYTHMPMYNNLYTYTNV